MTNCIFGFFFSSLWISSSRCLFATIKESLGVGIFAIDSSDKSGMIWTLCTPNCFTLSSIVSLAPLSFSTQMIAPSLATKAASIAILSASTKQIVSCESTPSRLMMTARISLPTYLIGPFENISLRIPIRYDSLVFSFRMKITVGPVIFRLITSLILTCFTCPSSSMPTAYHIS